MTPARVIGAGLSGLVAAWHLADRGFDVTVSDRAARPGGLILTHDTPNGIVETAANAFVWDSGVEAWFSRLDLSPVFPLSTSSRRYIFRDRRLRRWPLSTTESLGMAGRLGVAAATRSLAARDPESVAAWGNRVLGAPAREWLLEPAMQGIYAAPASTLSARAIFSGRKRGPRRLVAPAGGMGTFVARLHQRLFEKGVRFEFDCPVETIDADCPTVIATDARSAARLLEPHAPLVTAILSRLRLAPLTTVTQFFASHDHDPRGFGVLFPARSGVRALGVLFNTDIFAGRGHARSETWIVGDRDTALTQQPDDALMRMLRDDRRTLTGRDDVPADVRITRWPAAIPVYDATILEIMGAVSSLPPWLALAGNYLGRIGVAALLDVAGEAAARVAEGTGH